MYVNTLTGVLESPQELDKSAFKCESTVGVAAFGVGKGENPTR